MLIKVNKIKAENSNITGDAALVCLVSRHKLCYENAKCLVALVSGLVL